MNNKQPLCSVIVLNYFGEKVLTNTLASLMQLNYPKYKYEIIVVDNNSHDKSRDIITDWAGKYPQIKPLFLDKNLGFAGGNNEGIKKALGDYVLLLNNDCVVNKNWLLEIVKTALSDPRIFAVNSKLVLYPRYIPFSIPVDELVMQAITITKSNLLNYNPRIHIPWDLNNDEKCYEGQLIYDPLHDTSIEVSFKCSLNKRSVNDKRLSLNLGNKLLSKQVFSLPCRKGIYKFKISLTGSLLKTSFDKIQNAGIMVFQDGAGRDIGTVVTNQSQNYEIDSGQYGKVREVYAACAAAVLYRKKILDMIGLLDDSFFMYYEDVEICERARSQGFKVVFCPKGIVRHLHALSSKEWSTFFIYHSEKGRLMHILYNFPPSVFILEYLKLTARILLVMLHIVKGLKDLDKVSKFVSGWYYSLLGIRMMEQKKKTDLGKIIAYIKVVVYFSVVLPLLIIKKFRKYQSMKYKVKVNLYNTILKGGWYFD